MVNKMINFKNLGRGVALASSTLALGSALAISSSIYSAQAATLGAINITGAATIGNLDDESPDNDFVSFSEPFTTVSSEGVLSNLTASSISTINLERTGTGVEALGTISTSYSANTSSPFITFTDGSTFVVNNSSTLAIRDFTSSDDVNIVGYTFPDLQGSFINSAGKYTSQGVLTANQISGTGVNGSFSFTLSAVEFGGPHSVPEPTTTSALVALGMGAFFTNNLVKKSKVKIKA